MTWQKTENWQSMHQLNNIHLMRHISYHDNIILVYSIQQPLNCDSENSLFHVLNNSQFGNRKEISPVKTEYRYTGSGIVTAAFLILRLTAVITSTSIIFYCSTNQDGLTFWYWFRLSWKLVFKMGVVRDFKMFGKQHPEGIWQLTVINLPPVTCKLLPHYLGKCKKLIFQQHSNL